MIYLLIFGDFSAFFLSTGGSFGVLGGSPPCHSELNSQARVEIKLYSSPDVALSFHPMSRAALFSKQRRRLAKRLIPDCGPREELFRKLL